MENAERGMNYIYGELEQYHFLRYFGVTKTTANFHSIPKNWILRFYWADKNGDFCIEKINKKGPCVEINPHREFPEGDRHAVFYEIIRELKKMRMKGSKEVCSKIEEIIQKELLENPR